MAYIILCHDYGSRLATSDSCAFSAFSEASPAASDPT